MDDDFEKFYETKEFQQIVEEENGEEEGHELFEDLAERVKDDEPQSPPLREQVPTAQNVVAMEANNAGEEAWEPIAAPQEETKAAAEANERAKDIVDFEDDLPEAYKIKKIAEEEK